MQTMVISHLFALVICVKVTTGESICVRSLCEDTLYNIKIRTYVDVDIYSKGSKNQCPMSTSFVLKFVIPYNVQWFNVGIPIAIYNPDCRSFMICNQAENKVDDIDYACSNTRFFLFREALGSNECGYMFYIHEGTLFGITADDESQDFRFISLKNYSLTGDVDLIVNRTGTWCFHTTSKLRIGAGNMANPLTPYCKYYKYQNNYSSNGTSHVLSTSSRSFVVQNQASTVIPSQMVTKRKKKRQKCRAHAKRMV